MGRKIPGRKHRGVKDPEKQAAVRLNRVKDKINAPPTNPDDQEVPKSLQRIIDLKNKTKSGQFDLKRKKKSKLIGKEVTNEANVSKPEIKKYAGKPEKPVPEFKQLPGEGDRQFLSRITRICQKVAKEVEFEQKYGVEIKRNEAGEVEDVVKTPKDELEVLIKKVKKEKNTKSKKKKATKGDTSTPKLTKSQKWQLKKKEKKQKKKSKGSDEFERYKDQVKFGEIVHAPPTLVAPRKIDKSQNAPRPGKKNLLLKSMLDKENLTSQRKNPNKSDVNRQKTINRAIDKKGKRKDLPNALRRQLDSQQKEIISAYKSIKAKKYSTR